MSVYRHNFQYLVVCALLVWGGYAIGVRLAVKSSAGMASDDRRARTDSALNEIIPDVHLGRATPIEALGYLSRLRNVGLLLEPPETRATIELPDSNLYGRKMVFDLQLHNVSLRQVLAEMTRCLNVSESAYDPDFRIQNGFIEILPSDRGPAVETCTYDVRDLLVDDWRWINVSRHMGMGSAQKIEQRGRLLTRLITEMIDPGSWIDQGGKLGRVNYGWGRLVITQTPETQKAIAKFLQILREPDR